MTRRPPLLLPGIVLFLTIAASATLSPSDVPGSTSPSPSLEIVRGEVRESAVGWHPYPDPVPDDVLPEVPLPVGEAVAAPRSVTYQGVAGWADPSHGSRYLAMREKRGTRVRLCSTDGCWTATVNDYGPKKSTGSIADIAVVQWERMTGLPRSRGLGQFTVTVLSRPHGATPTLPPTDLAPGG